MPRVWQPPIRNVSTRSSSSSSSHTHTYSLTPTHWLFVGHGHLIENIISSARSSSVWYSTRLLFCRCLDCVPVHICCSRCVSVVHVYARLLLARGNCISHAFVSACVFGACYERCVSICSKFIGYFCRKIHHHGVISRSCECVYAGVCVRACMESCDTDTRSFLRHNTFNFRCRAKLYLPTIPLPAHTRLCV